MDRYDEYYRSTPDVFGSEPNSILVRHADLIDPAYPVLDIGCGQGRNSLFLARRGFTVHAVDPSGVAVRTVTSTAEAEGLEIRTIHAGFEELNTDEGPYGTVLAFGVIPDLRRQEVTILARVVGKILAPNGLLFVTAFGTWDPAHRRHLSEWTREDENSFCSLDGLIRTYLEPGELTALFPGFETIELWEGTGPEHRHGDGPPERHGLAEGLLRAP